MFVEIDISINHSWMMFVQHAGMGVPGVEGGGGGAATPSLARNIN